MTLAVIETALTRLANSMRIYCEAYIRYQRLVETDKEEAIENLDRAFESKLEAFHSLYDVSKDLVQYFDHPDTCLIIALRNALHHRNHPLLTSLLPELWLSGDPVRLLGAAYLLSRHTMVSGGPSPMNHYVKLEDIYSRLDPKKNSPYIETTMSRQRLERRFLLLESGLALDKIWSKAKLDRYPDNQVYLDIIPVFISAVARTFTTLQAAGVKFQGFDASTYKTPFTSELRVNLNSYEFKLFRMNHLQIAFGPKLTINNAATYTVR
jgi:hypothetical protein